MLSQRPTFCVNKNYPGSSDRADCLVGHSPVFCERFCSCRSEVAVALNADRDSNDTPSAVHLSTIAADAPPTPDPYMTWREEALTTVARREHKSPYKPTNSTPTASRCGRPSERHVTLLHVKIQRFHLENTRNSNGAMLSCLCVKVLQERSEGVGVSSGHAA